MAYNPAEESVLDRIRGLVGDTATPALIADDTYTSVIARYPENWKRAGAEMALRVARVIENDPASLGSDGDSLSWRDRTKALYETAKRLTTEADDEDASTDVPTAIPYMPVLVPVPWR